MLNEEIAAIKARNERRRVIKANTTPGPWYVRNLDDDLAMSFVAVSTRPDTGKNERWPDFDAGEILAATLVQAPRYVDITDQLWDENAAFIAHARNDDVEDDVDRLIAEIELLRAQRADW